MTGRCAVVLVVVASAWAVATSGGIPESEFVARRDAVGALLDSTSVAIFRAVDTRMRSADVEYRYRQESNFLYLTGVNEPSVVLVIAGRRIGIDGIQTTRVFLGDKGIRQRISQEGLLKEGIVVDISRLQEILTLVCTGASTLYLSAPDMRFVNDWINNRPLFLDRDSKRELERRFPGLKIKNAATLVGPLRGIKSPAEVALIRKSITATGDGLVGAMAACRPGLYEYQLQAVLEYEMTNDGAESVGFPSIVGSGPNSLDYHYSFNRRRMEAGEIVVMDVGAEVEGYSADVTRSFPVTGEFSEEQRHVYEAVLDAQKAVIAMIKPGVAFVELERTARASLTKSGFGKYIGHGVSHHLGLDTHDAGMTDTLRVGMVITVEPGAYISASDTVMARGYRGWGIRIEDDVLVTPTGHDVLSGGIPKEIGEIERIMKR